MMKPRKNSFRTFAPILIFSAIAGAQQSPDPAHTETDKMRTVDQTRHVLGPDDQIVIRALDAEEISDKPIRIDSTGSIKLPLVGRVHAAGMTVEQLEAEIAERLKTYIQQPEVSVSTVESHSQPVSVLGSVKNPGVHQIGGRKNLYEILSMAGGLDSEAGNRIRITRKLEYGRIPLPTAGDDLTGQYSIAEVSAKAIMEAQNPQENIVIQPYDVISVPRAEMVYVIGEVKKAGGFVLRDRETVSVLQALSLAEGLVRTAAPQRAKILRPSPGGTQRTEILVDLRSLLAGKGMDTVLKPDDILFIPNDAAKSAILRAAETALGMGTGIATGLVIYRR